MVKIDLKNIAPYITAVVLFIICTLTYFSPLLKDKEIVQNDISVWKGASREIMDFKESTGESSLWTNTMFSGMPSYQISVAYPSSIFTYVQRGSQLLFGTGRSVFISLLGFYILLLVFRVDPWLSIVGAIAFGLSSYLFIIIEAGHMSKANAMSLMAPITAGIILAFRGRLMIGGVITAFFLGLQIKENHLQITYYLAMVLAIYTLIELIHAIKNKRILEFAKTVGVLLLAAVLAVLCNAALLWGTLDYSKHTTRGKSELTFNQEDKTSGLDRSYVTAWSYGVGETMTLMIPNFKGGPSGYIGEDKGALKQIAPQFRQAVGSTSRYWGAQPFTSGPVYLGAIVCFLFVWGLFTLKNKYKWWLLSATVLSIMLSWGNNFMSFTNLFLDYFPGYNKFRTVSMTLVMAGMAVPLMGMLALDKIIKSPELFKKKEFLIAIGITGGLSFLYYLIPSALSSFFNDGEIQSLTQQLGSAQWPPNQINSFLENVEQARIQIFKSDAIRSAIFIILAGAAIWAFVKKIITQQILVGAILVLVLVDMWVVDKRYLNNDNFIAKRKNIVPYHPSPADMQILNTEIQAKPDIKSLINTYAAQLKENKKKARRGSPNLNQDEINVIGFRALNDLTNFRVINLAVSTFNDASTSYFHKSIGGYHGAKLKRYQELIEFHIGRNNTEVLNMLNAKYYIVNDNGNVFAQQNPTALGNAWFVSDHRLVANADSEITALSNFNPAKTAIIDKRFEEYISQLSMGVNDGTASINMDVYKPNYISYQSKSKSEGLAVFSEIYYDNGWNAYLDGDLVPHVRANYLLRAMRIPAGDHTIEFKFEPNNYIYGETISLIFSSLLVLFIGGAGFREFKSRNREN